MKINPDIRTFFKNAGITAAAFAVISFFTFIMFLVISALGCRNNDNTAVLLSDVLSQKILRFHVIGASNDEKDQQLKLLVRDEVIHYINDFTDDLSTKEEIYTLIEEHISVIKGISQKILAENGCNSTVTVNLENRYFPIREYGSIIVPAGYYDSLCIYIGEAKGKNWWCIMFPKLCFSDPFAPFPSEESMLLLKSVLTEEEFDELTQNTSDGFEDKKIKIKYRFKLLELLDELF